MFLAELFSGEKEQVLIVELDKDSRHNPSVEDEESIRSLKNHPGFVALSNRLRLQAAALDAKLHQRQDSLRDLDRLQAGIEWCNWLETQVDKAISKHKEAVAVKPLPTEQAMFDQVIRRYQGV
jgi:hypothetical protein